MGACFINDGEIGTIYTDLTSPLGVVAPFLFHELIHALDEGVWEAARRPLAREAKDQVMLMAETRAFEAQHQFVAELGDRFPDYRTFLAKHYPKAKILHERMTSVDVADLYGFKAS